MTPFREFLLSAQVFEKISIFGEFHDEINVIHAFEDLKEPDDVGVVKV